MSSKTQSEHMKHLGKLLSQDLGYIHGERESGPNGAKKEFLHKGAVFMRALAKDLGFARCKVHVNNSGIACSGEVYLKGMWGEGNGLSIELSQIQFSDYCMVYRTIEDIKGKKSGRNEFVGRTALLGGNYAGLLNTLRDYRKHPVMQRDVA